MAFRLSSSACSMVVIISTRSSGEGEGFIYFLELGMSSELLLRIFQVLDRSPKNLTGSEFNTERLKVLLHVLHVLIYDPLNALDDLLFGPYGFLLDFCFCTWHV